MPVCSMALALALTLTLSLPLIGIVLRMSAEVAFTAPLFPVARVVRMVGCIIHFGFYL
jgi:hypothetical protein